MPNQPANTKIRDAVAAAQEAEDLGVEQLHELRKELAELDARREAERSAVADRLAAAEERFAAAAAERDHQARVAAAQAGHDAARGDYAATTASADAAIAEVQALTARIAEAFATAVAAELSRIAAGAGLVGARQRLIQLGETVDNAVISDARLHRLDPNDPLIGVRHAAVVVQPELERQLDQLAGRRPSKLRIG